MQTDHRAFLERRALEEREQAKNASDPAAHRAHIKMAKEYEERLKALDGANPSAAARGTD